MMRKIVQHTIFMLILVMISLPLLQMRFRFVKEKPLFGAFVPAGRADFNRNNWNSGAYQEQVENYLKDHLGFRNFMVRLQNQLDFSLFRKANAEGAIVGKSGQLYEYDYIRAWLAIDYPGDAFVNRKLNRTRYVQEYLKREKGIDLVVVFEPGKASYYPEFIPDRFARQKSGPSTYEIFIRKARDIGVDFIDLQAYFMQLKPDSKFPLFPRHGTHWSVYGSKFAADSLVPFIENRRNITMPKYRSDSLVISSQPWDSDDDVLKTMNLLCPLKGEKLAYPVFVFDTLSGGDRPMVLPVADSYYWNIFNTRLPAYLFANETYWYFNSLVYPDFYYRPVYTADIDLQEETEKQDIIFLMVTERFLYRFDWTFIDRLYALYTPDWLKDPVYDNINAIMRNDELFDGIIEKAQHKGISLEAALQMEGRYMIYNNNRTEFMIRFGPEHFKRIISQDPGWMKHIREKAAGQGVAVEETLLKDALYIFEQEYPVLYEMNRDIEELKERISAGDSILLEAAQYRFDPGVFMDIAAARIYREEEIARTSYAIRSDPTWLEHVRRKAEEKNISLEEMISLDAEYVYEERLK
ncbi:MAG: hypothetical protein K0B08_09780 [Bacteroidales bacterium]|nr:hypothetical protein [Bacteroidales bacterium]